MAAENQNFKIMQREEKEIFITIRDSQDNLVSIDNAEIKWIVTEERNSTAKVIEKTNQPDGGIVIVSQGRIKITLTSDDTANLIKEVYYHKLEVTDTLENYYIPTIGTIRVKPNPIVI